MGSIVREGLGGGVRSLCGDLSLSTIITHYCPALPTVMPGLDKTRTDLSFLFNNFFLYFTTQSDSFTLMKINHQMFV